MPTTESTISGGWTQVANGTTVDICPRGTDAELVVGTTSTAPAATAAGHFLPRNTNFNLALNSGERAWVRSAGVKTSDVIVITT